MRAFVVKLTKTVFIYCFFNFVARVVFDLVLISKSQIESTLSFFINYQNNHPIHH